MVHPQRSGFTLVELLVTLGVIGLLLSLLLTGIQSARSAARRTQCLNNIRQMALACHSFEAAHNTFPRTVDGIDGNRGNIAESLSPHAGLLPHLDQRPLFDSLMLPDDPQGLSEPPSSSKNSHALAAFVPVFVCPSDGLATGGATNYRACMGIGPGIHSGNGWEYGNGSGIWRAWRKRRAAEVTDGLSNTVLFGEKLTGDRDAEEYTPWRDMARLHLNFVTIAETETACNVVGSVPAEHRSYGGATWLFGGFQATWYNHILPPNAQIPDCGGLRGAFAARSFHPGGVNITFADGSGRFVSEQIDLAVWRSIATRHRGEVLSAF